MDKHKRRQFIGYSCAGVAGAALTAGGWWYLQQPDQAHMQPTGLGAATDQIIANLNGVSTMGQWVIEEHPDYRQSVTQLAQQLRSRLKLAESGPIPGQQFSQYLQQRIQQDFSEGALLSAHNWQISETEALLAALRFQAIGITAVAIDQTPQEQDIVNITNWGPRTTSAGTLPNSFGEGFAALWFDAKGAPRWAQIAINHHRLNTNYRENRVLVASFQGQAEFQKQLFGKAGEYPITLHNDMNNTWQTIGTFIVTEAIASEQADVDVAIDSAFCQVNNWGPRQTNAGVAKHPQKDGGMGVWIDIQCAPDDTQVMAAGQLLKAHITADVITTSIPPELFQQATQIPLSLVSDSAAEQLEIGILMVDP